MHYPLFKMILSDFVSTVVVILCWYSKKWDPRIWLELWQLKSEQLSPAILKFSTKHLDNPLNLNNSCRLV